MKDKISIIVPVYNVEQYLDKCLDSICNQTYKNLEIILVDDGSTDSSGIICDKWKEKDKRIIVVHQKNSGVSSARNKGLEICTGEYIGFVDSDDYISIDMYDFLYDLLKKYNATISICSGFDVEDGNIFFRKKSNILLEMDNIEGIKKIFEMGYFGTGICNKLFSAKVIKNLRFSTQLSCGEELDVLYFAIKNSKKIVYSSTPKYYYVVRQNSETHKRAINDGLVKNFNNILIKEKTFLMKDKDLYNIFINHYISSCFQVYNKCIMYNGKNEMKQSMKQELIKYKNNFNKNEFKRSKQFQFYLFYNFETIYNILIKLYSILRR